MADALRPPPLSRTSALDAAFDAARHALDEHDAKVVLRMAGISVPAGVRLGAGSKVGDALSGLTPPFALKGLSDTPLHKSDIGAVRLNLSSPAEVDVACAEIVCRMKKAGFDCTGFLVEEMARPGIEMVIGGMTDSHFGPMIMLGAGGIYAEIFADVTFRLCPISGCDVDEMFSELRIMPILKGARGKQAVNLKAIRDALMALGGPDGIFLRQAGRIEEFDLNPVIVRPDGLTAVDARFVLKAVGAMPAPINPRPAVTVDAFRPLFAPRTVAVAGASSTGTSAGNRYIRVLKASGFAGTIYPIHPSAKLIEGLVAYRSLADLPKAADYAYLTVPADQAEQVLSTAAGKVEFAQVMASASDDHRGAFEERLCALARKGGFRLVGPNCMGTHSPRGRVTFMEGVSVEPGPVGIGCQSGGLGMDILRRGQNLGLTFSGLVTLGNCADIDPSDMLEYYLSDSETEVIGLYVEDVKDGARFQALARNNAGQKPIVLLVGGLTDLGRNAASSHTGAMASSGQAWQALCQQTGMILTQTLDGFLDALQMCVCLQPRFGTVEPSVTLFGNGGGTSVLATDALDRAGFTLARPKAEAEVEFAKIALPPGASLGNPIDLPASVLKEHDGRVSANILRINRELTRPYATIVHLNLPVILGYRHVEGFMTNLMDAVLGTSPAGLQASHQLLVLRSDRSEEVDGWRRTFRRAAMERGVPTFDEITHAIDALGNFRGYEDYLTGAASDTSVGIVAKVKGE